jgi:hypothetical protein
MLLAELGLDSRLHEVRVWKAKLRERDEHRRGPEQGEAKVGRKPEVDRSKSEGESETTGAQGVSVGAGR